MGTGSGALKLDSDTPVPTQSELNQIVSSVLANQANSGQAQYVPPQASVYTQPEASIYTPPAQTIYSPPPSQTATPGGITALLPQDQGAQTSMPTASVYTPPVASIYTPPEASIYTPPAASVYTPPAASVFTPTPPSTPVPEDLGRTMAPTQTAPTTQAPVAAPPPAPTLATPSLDDSLAALRMALGKQAPDLKYDVNGDGKVDETDHKGLHQAYLGKDPGFAFVSDAFRAEKARTPQEYADETKAYQDRVAAQQKETERQSTLLADAQKLNGIVNADLVANNPNLNPQQLASLAQKNYWSNESEAFSRVMSGMESGKAQLKTRSLGADEFGNDMSELVLTTGEHPGYDSLVLRPTAQPGIYQFGTPNQVAGGTISGIIQADPEKGTYTPIQDYTKQIKYTPGSSGSFFGNMIGDFGDIYKSLGPIAPILGNAFVPGLGSALSAVAALDEGNTTGALLSGLSAAGAYGGDAARNALAAEVSGNADLASQYSSGLGGALAQNLPEIKTATSAAQLANALDKGNVLGALSAGANLTDTQIPSELKTGIAGLGLAQALASGNVPQAMALGSQFLPPEASGADVGPPPPPAGGISSLLPSAETPADQQVATADTSLPAGAPAGLEQLVQTQPLVQQAEVAQTQPSNIEQVLPIVPAGIEQLAQNQEPIALPSQQLTQETAAGLEQLANAINNPDITSSYTGTQVADLSGTTGLPTDQPGEQDLEQLGVGLPALTGGDVTDRKSTRLNSSHVALSRMPSSA